MNSNNAFTNVITYNTICGLSDWLAEEKYDLLIGVSKND